MKKSFTLLCSTAGISLLLSGCSAAMEAGRDALTAIDDATLLPTEPAPPALRGSYALVSAGGDALPATVEGNADQTCPEGGSLLTATVEGGQVDIAEDGEVIGVTRMKYMCGDRDAPVVQEVQSTIRGYFRAWDRDRDQIRVAGPRLQMWRFEVEGEGAALASADGSRWEASRESMAQATDPPAGAPAAGAEQSSTQPHDPHDMLRHLVELSGGRLIEDIKTPPAAIGEDGFAMQTLTLSIFRHGHDEAEQQILVAAQPDPVDDRPIARVGDDVWLVSRVGDENPQPPLRTRITAVARYASEYFLCSPLAGQDGWVYAVQADPDEIDTSGRSWGLPYSTMRRADLEVVEQSAAEVPPAVRARHEALFKQTQAQVFADLEDQIPSYMGGAEALRRMIESEWVTRLFRDARFAPVAVPGGSRAYLVPVSVPVNIHEKQGVDDGTSFLALIAESGEVLQKMEGRFGFATVRQNSGEQTTLIEDMPIRWENGQIVPPQRGERYYGCT